MQKMEKFEKMESNLRLLELGAQFALEKFVPPPLSQPLCPPFRCATRSNICFWEIEMAEYNP